MFNFSAIASNVLNSIDNVAKETLEEPRISATELRSSRRREEQGQDLSEDEDDDGIINDVNDPELGDEAEERNVLQESHDDAKEMVGGTVNPHSSSAAGKLSFSPMGTPIAADIHHGSQSGAETKESSADIVVNSTSTIERTMDSNNGLAVGIAALEMSNDAAVSSRSAVDSIGNHGSSYAHKEEEGGEEEEEGPGGDDHSDLTALHTSNITTPMVKAVSAAGGTIVAGSSSNILGGNGAERTSDLTASRTASRTHPVSDDAIDNVAAANTMTGMSDSQPALSATKITTNNNINNNNNNNNNVPLSASSSEHTNTNTRVSASNMPMISATGTPILTSAQTPTSISSATPAAVDTSATTTATANTNMPTTAAIGDVDHKEKNIKLSRALKKKNQEIEKLNRECLDLEEQTAALKLEVQEAWENYKQAQEKAAAQEMDLQEEIRALQKAKLADKQSAAAQLTRMNEELAQATQQIAAIAAQKEEIQSNLTFVTEENTKWEDRLAQLQRELGEAKAGSVQGVQALRDELLGAQVHAEQLRQDNASLLRQNQGRQEELERENTELSASVAANQKEIARLQFALNNNSSQQWVGSGGGGGGSSGGGSGEVSVSAGAAGMGDGMGSDGYIGRDYVALQKEVLSVTTHFEAEQEKSEGLERQVRQLEREIRAMQLNEEDQRKRHTATVDDLLLKIKQLEAHATTTAGKSHRIIPPATSADGAASSASTAVGLTPAVIEDDEKGLSIHGGAAGGEGGDAGAGFSGYVLYSETDYEALVKELQEHRTQSQNLSKLLLKKQGAVLELQAERSALKSRLLDMQARCSAAEQQVAKLRDLEDGGDDLTEYAAGTTTSSSSSGLQNRRSGANGGSSSSSAGSAFGGSQQSGQDIRRTKVISDLEKIGVKPGARVATAVNMIDTWTMLSGRFLRSYPLARLGFVFYLLVLHLWALFILVLHTHSLDLDSQPGDPRKQFLHP